MITKILGFKKYPMFDIQYIFHKQKIMKEIKPIGRSHQKFNQEVQQNINSFNQIGSSCKKQKPTLWNLQIPCKKCFFCLPVFISIILLTIAIIYEGSKKSEQYYCYKTSYNIPNQSYNFSQNVLEERQIRVKTRYGFDLYLNPDDITVSEKIAKTGSYQPEIINLIGQLVQKSDYVLTVGTHSGLETIVVAKILTTGQLFTTAQSEEQLGLLKKNIQINKITSRYNLIKLFEEKNAGNKGAYINNSNSENSFMKIFTENEINFIFISNQRIKPQVLQSLIVNVDNWRTRPIFLLKKSDQGDSVNRLVQKNKLQNYLVNELQYRAYVNQGGDYKKACSLGKLIEIKSFNTLQFLSQPYLLFTPTSSIPPS